MHAPPLTSLTSPRPAQIDVGALERQKADRKAAECMDADRDMCGG